MRDGLLLNGHTLDEPSLDEPNLEGTTLDGSTLYGQTLHRNTLDRPTPNSSKRETRNVESVARVRDEMEVIAREARISL